MQRLSRKDTEERPLTEEGVESRCLDQQDSTMETKNEASLLHRCIVNIDDHKRWVSMMNWDTVGIFLLQLFSNTIHALDHEHDIL